MVHADARHELADGTEPEHGERASFRDIRVLHALPRGGQDVAEIQVTIVGEVRSHTNMVVISQRYPQILRLPTRHLAVELRVAEEGCTAAVLAHLGGLALRLQSLAAHETVAARDRERNDDAVADSQLGDIGADLYNDAHRLVSEDV